MGLAVMINFSNPRVTNIVAEHKSTTREHSSVVEVARDGVLLPLKVLVMIKSILLCLNKSVTFWTLGEVYFKMSHTYYESYVYYYDASERKFRCFFISQGHSSSFAKSHICARDWSKSLNIFTR